MRKLKLNKTSKISITIIGLILIVVATLFYLSGNNPGKESVTKFITKYYTVTSEELEKFKNYQEKGIDGDYLKYYELQNEKMKDELTTKAHEVYVANRTMYIRLIKPLAQDFTVQVKDIKSKKVEIKEDSLLSYEVTFTVVKKNRKDNKETEENITKKFYMSKEDDKWKINEFNNFDTNL